MRTPPPNVARISLLAAVVAAFIVSAGTAFGGTETVLYSFGPQTGANPIGPEGKVLLDSSNSIYGVTLLGGLNNVGTEYRLSQFESLTLLNSFKYPAQYPAGGLTTDGAGTLIGTTQGNTSEGSLGTVFATSPSGRTRNVALAGTPNAANPSSGLVSDNSGGFVGTSLAGGEENSPTIYRVSASGVVSVVFSFVAILNTLGVPATGNLAVDAEGNIYGATKGARYGSVYVLPSSGALTVLHTFTGGAACGVPNRGLTLDAAGNIYGTTLMGGAPGREGCLYKLTPAGVFTLLYSFGIRNRNADPLGGVVLDAVGNIYGTTQRGGPAAMGTVYKYSTDGTVTALYSFTGGADGGEPVDGPVLNAQGKLYGATYVGGTYQLGVLYKVTP